MRVRRIQRFSILRAEIYWAKKEGRLIILLPLKVNLIENVYIPDP